MTWCSLADVARNLTFDETALISPDKNGIIHSKQRVSTMLVVSEWLSVVTVPDARDDWDRSGYSMKAAWTT